jgi:3-oxoacyl-(acyl-carrier-protein) synthase
MKRRRVKITGIGPVTPAGIGKDEFWKGILEPVSRVQPYKELGEEYGPFVAAHIPKFNVHDYVEINGVLKGAARHTLFAVAGTLLALKDAGIGEQTLKDARSAIIIGTTLMDFGGIGSTINAVNKRGIRAAQGRVVYTSNVASVPGTVNHVLGITARTMSLQSSCCSGLDAIGHAAGLIATGEIDIALCGGSEAPLYLCPLLELRSAGLTPPTDEMPERLSRPFDLWRTTGVVSEGACLFVLEPEESPREGYGYVTGYAYANDEPDDLCSGIAVASRLAMAQAGVRPNQIDAINAWGPGHKLIDAGEARAMVSVFQSVLPEIPVLSIKGAIGAPFGAAPAMQVATAALGLKYGLIPPTVNWEFPDPACPLNLSNRSRAVEYRVALVNAHGLAGVNASLVLQRC